MQLDLLSWTNTSCDDLRNFIESNSLTRFAFQKFLEIRNNVCHANDPEPIATEDPIEITKIRAKEIFIDNNA